MSLPTVPARPIDPLAGGAAGVYRDDLVEVRVTGVPRPRRSLHTVRTRHFDLRVRGERVLVEHVVPLEEIDDDLAGLLAAELFGPGWLRGSELFERIFTGVVLSGAGDPLEAWERFYRNTLARVEASVAGVRRGVGGGTGGHGTIADYAPVYAHAQALLRGADVLELGCCFGFLSLRLAAAGRRVTASDVSPGTVRLLAQVAPRLGLALRTRVADAAHVPSPDASVDDVLAVHLLEHLDPDHGDRVVAEAVRLARRRAVVAVPLEEEADETWGHVRTVSLADLEAWGRRANATYGVAWEVHEHHGGWLVLDRT